MPERINLGYVERLGLKRMIDARLRELHAVDGNGPNIQAGLLHGTSVPWPPMAFRQARVIKPLPSLDYYDQASDNR